jgi:hypothetical protein
VALTLAEIKDLLAYGQELGLQHLEAEGVKVVYGPRAVLPVQNGNQSDDESKLGLLAHYSAMGRAALKSHSDR